MEIMTWLIEVIRGVIEYGSTLIGIAFILLTIYIGKILKDEKRCCTGGTYYWGRKNSRSIKSDTRIIFWVEVIMGFVLGVSCIATGMKVMYPGIPENAWYGMGKYIDPIPQLMLTTVLALFTVIGLIMVVNKKYYIGFDIGDIIRTLNLYRDIQILLFLTGTSYVIYYLNPLIEVAGDMRLHRTLNAIILASFFVFLGITLRGCYSITGVIFTVNRFEIQLMTCLYQNFWYKTPTYSKGQIDNQGIEVVVDFLLEQFKVASDAIKTEEIQNIKRITYHTVLTTKQQYNMMLAKRARWLYIGMVLLLMLLMWIAPLIAYGHNAINTICSIGVMVVLLLLTKYREDIQSAVTVAVYNRNGYLVQYHEGDDTYKEGHYTSALQIRPHGRWHEYIKVIQNILYVYKFVLYKNKKLVNYMEMLVDRYVETVEPPHARVLRYLMLYLKYEKEQGIINYLPSDPGHSIQNKNSFERQMIRVILLDIYRPHSKQANRLNSDLFRGFLDRLS